MTSQPMHNASLLTAFEHSFHLISVLLLLVLVLLLLLLLCDSSAGFDDKSAYAQCIFAYSRGTTGPLPADCCERLPGGASSSSCCGAIAAAAAAAAGAWDFTRN
jgi:hypothetical protein